ncbi:MAG: hypothetical protein EP329_04930 [Deltaproteobacteria bacterium]|nr:MAG: hypothetical protein EP329_04930 [Deltaproteobacteria bacterium]
MPRRSFPLAAVTGLLIAAAGCTSSSGGASCTDAACASPTGYVTTQASVESSLRAAASKGCARFFSDCAYVCDSPFFSCPTSQAQCVEDTVADYLEDFDLPAVSPILAATCGLDIQGAACTDIPPDTPACDYALVEGCANDVDDLGTPYSWLTPTTLQAPAQVAVHLCEGVDEWLAVRVEPGQHVTVHALEGEPSFGHVWLELTLQASPQVEPTGLTSESLTWAGEDPAAFDPVDVAGTYLVRMDLSGAPAVDFTLRVEVVDP